MIWLRRISAIPLILIFVVIFVFVLLLTQLNGALGNPKFYNDQLSQADMYNWIYDDFMPVALDEAQVDMSSDIPFPINAIKSDLIDATEATFPPEWLQKQVESADTKLIRYVLGDKNEFTITIELRDRVDHLKTAILEITNRQEIYDYLMYEIITPTIMTNLGSAVNLPFQVTLTKQEIFEAINEVLPQKWVQEHLADVINGIAAYLKGGDTINIEINLADKKTAAMDILTTQTDQKLEVIFNSLPQCSLAQFNQMVANLHPGKLPSCRPSGVSYQQFKTTLNINVAASVNQMIGDHIPNSWAYTDAQLRQSLGEDNAESLDKARDFITKGGVMTEADLRDKISDNPEDLQRFDNARHSIHTARTWLWALWLIPLLLLLFIGLLGGRSWKTKLIWALAVLFVTCLVIFIAIALIQSNVIDQHAQSLVGDPASKHSAMEMVMTTKGNEIAYNVISSFASGIQNKALCIMIFSGVLILGVIAWTVIRSRRGHSASK
ncbi:MAG: hypothetical protein NTZ04_06975 [Chloroflexi bacterium]|nr:hypothetical protein [Chloroflexota bacterium]